MPSEFNISIGIINYVIILKRYISITIKISLGDFCKPLIGSILIKLQEHSGTINTVGNLTGT
jgi:hypothetical protein